MAVTINDIVEFTGSDSQFNLYPQMDKRYGPYNSISTALTTLTTSKRCIGLTIGVKSGNSITEYWFKDGILDSNLVEKVDNVYQNYISNGGDKTKEDFYNTLGRVVDSSVYAILHSNTDNIKVEVTLSDGEIIEIGSGSTSTSTTTAPPTPPPVATYVTNLYTSHECTVSGQFGGINIATDTFPATYTVNSSSAPSGTIISCEAKNSNYELEGIYNSVDGTLLTTSLPYNWNGSANLRFNFKLKDSGGSTPTEQPAIITFQHDTRTEYSVTYNNNNVIVVSTLNDGHVELKIPSGVGEINFIVNSIECVQPNYTCNGIGQGVLPYTFKVTPGKNITITPIIVNNESGGSTSTTSTAPPSGKYCTFIFLPTSESSYTTNINEISNTIIESSNVSVNLGIPENRDDVTATIYGFTPTNSQYIVSSVSINGENHNLPVTMAFRAYEEVYIQPRMTKVASDTTTAPPTDSSTTPGPTSSCVLVFEPTSESSYTTNVSGIPNTVVENDNVSVTLAIPEGHDDITVAISGFTPINSQYIVSSVMVNRTNYNLPISLSFRPAETVFIRPVMTEIAQESTTTPTPIPTEGTGDSEPTLAYLQISTKDLDMTLPEESRTVNVSVSNGGGDSTFVLGEEPINYSYSGIGGSYDCEVTLSLSLSTYEQVIGFYDSDTGELLSNEQTYTYATPSNGMKHITIKFNSSSSDAAVSN